LEFAQTQQIPKHDWRREQVPVEGHAPFPEIPGLVLPVKGTVDRLLAYEL
jgi:hypothetical protein